MKLKRPAKISKKASHDSSVVVGKSAKNWHLPGLKRPSKKVALAALAVVVLAAISGGFAAIVIHKNEQHRRLVSGEVVKCTKSILSAASSQIRQRQLQQLNTTVEKIKKIPDFQQDPNCLYVITSYYVSLGDPQNAQKYYRDMDAVEPTSPKFNSILPAQKVTMSDLKSQITGLQQLQSQAEANFKAMSQAESNTQKQARKQDGK